MSFQFLKSRWRHTRNAFELVAEMVNAFVLQFLCYGLKSHFTIGDKFFGAFNFLVDEIFFDGDRFYFAEQTT